MRRSLLLTVGFLSLAALLLPDVTRATPGIFQGEIYEPAHEKVPQGWILVLGRNHMLRKVEISRATIVYANTIPARQRADPPHSALVDGTEVRITAEQDKSGEWRASRVEIIKLSRSRLHPADFDGASARLR
jgi:hypothetical protein